MSKITLTKKQQRFEKMHKFGVDWINGTLPLSDVNEVFKTLENIDSRLKKDRWVLASTGKYNYETRYMLDGEPAIQFMYNPLYDSSDNPLPVADMNNAQQNNGIFFTISGTGIRFLSLLGGEFSALHKLMFYFYSNGFRSSRFDVYCDILDKNNDVVPVMQDCFQRFQICELNKPSITTGFHRTEKNFKCIGPYIDDNGLQYYNCQLGHHGSGKGMFRCYNKRMEQISQNPKFADQIFKEYGVKDYWYRLEYELHSDTASRAFNACCESCFVKNEDGSLDNCSHLSFRNIFYGAAESLFTLVTYFYYDKSNMSKNPLLPEWQEFLESVSQNPYFVYVGADVFKSVPYVRSLSRAEANYWRLAAMIFGCSYYLSFLPADQQDEFWEFGKNKFFNNPHYNKLRDDISEKFNLSEVS